MSEEMPAVHTVEAQVLENYGFPVVIELQRVSAWWRIVVEALDRQENLLTTGWAFGYRGMLQMQALYDFEVECGAGKREEW